MEEKHQVTDNVTIITTPNKEEKMEEPKAENTETKETPKPKPKTSKKGGTKMRKKYKTITELVRHWIGTEALAKRGYEALEAEVLKRWPGSEFKKSHYHWHIGRARKLGRKVVIKSKREKLMDPKNRTTVTK